MIRQQAFKFRIEPTGAQERLLRQYSGMARFIFNKALAIQLAEQEATGKKQSGYATLCKQLTGWRNSAETPWLAEGPSQAQQQALKNLENGWNLHFKSLQKFKAGLITHSQIVEKPKFKRKFRHNSVRFPEAKQFKIDQEKTRIFLPKMGWVSYRSSRKILGDPKNLTLSLCAGHWYVSIQTEREVAQPRHPAATAAGIDVGIVRFATLWDGHTEQVIAPLNSFKKHEHRLAKAQRQMSRKVKFSSNWKRAKLRVQKIQNQIANVRNDFLHKASHSISKNHALLCIEDLQVSNMSRSASGTPEDPGRNVKAKSGLNKAILDQGWGEFGRQLDYKSAWQGGWLVAVPPANTSRECPVCGHTCAENRKTQSVFLCVACGHTENADLVASKNIRGRGLNLFEGRDIGRIACEVSGVFVPPAAGTLRSEQAAQAA
jgi:putative transposase